MNRAIPGADPREAAAASDEAIDAIADIEMQRRETARQAGSSEATSASDEVIDTIAEIEMQRRETEKRAGFAMSCSSALHRLNELLDHETEALRLRGADSRHPQNVKAVTLEIGRVKALSGGKSQQSSPLPGNAQTGPRQGSWRNAAVTPARNKGRKTMGRNGGR